MAELQDDTKDEMTGMIASLLAYTEMEDRVTGYITHELTMIPSITDGNHGEGMRITPILVMVSHPTSIIPQIPMIPGQERDPDERENSNLALMPSPPHMCTRNWYIHISLLANRVVTWLKYLNIGLPSSASGLSFSHRILDHWCFSVEISGRNEDFAKSCGLWLKTADYG